MKRYAVGAVCGTIAFAAIYGLLIVGLQASSGRPVRLRSLANLALALSFINIVVALLLQGPILLVIRQFRGDSVGRGVIALAVIGLAPIGAFAAWLMFRETNETVAGLLTYVRNVPSEAIINLAPTVVSTSVFSLWMLSPVEPRRARSLEPEA